MKNFKKLVSGGDFKGGSLNTGMYNDGKMVVKSVEPVLVIEKDEERVKLATVIVMRSCYGLRNIILFIIVIIFSGWALKSSDGSTIGRRYYRSRRLGIPFSFDYSAESVKPY